MPRAFRLPLLVALIGLVPAAAAARNLLDEIYVFTEDNLIRPLETIQRDPDGPPPFRVALMLPSDGALSEAADRIRRGWRIAAAMSDGYVADRPIDLLRGETAGGPDDVLESAGRLLETEGVDVYAGVIGTHAAEALFDYTRTVNRPLILAVAIGENVLAGECRPHVARTSFNVAPYQAASGRFIAAKYGSMVTIAPASPSAHPVIRRLTEAYRAAGGRIVEQVWAPPERRYDWNTWLSRAAQRGPHILYAFFQGRNAERIVHAHSRMQLKTHFPLTGPEWLFGPRAMVRRAKHTDGARFLASHVPTRDIPANRIFVDAYRTAYSEDPDIYAYLGYENALAVLLTAAELGGRVPDADAFVSTMKKVHYDGLMPRGPFAFNDANSAVLTRLFWVEVLYDGDEARMRERAMIPVDMDEATCGTPKS